MFNIPLEILIATYLIGIATGFAGAIALLQWLDKGPIEKLAKRPVKPWPTNAKGHANRRAEDRQEGVKSIHGYQPHTSTKPVQPPGAE